MNPNDFSSFTNVQLADYLDQRSAKIAARDLDFCASLIATARRDRMTEKQRYWLEQMAGRLDAPPQQERTKLGELAGVMALFDRAKAHLKSPAIVIGMAGEEVRLSIAGPNARMPGSINVASNGGFSERDWYGRILVSGEFEPSKRVAPPEGLIDGLKRFAEHPAEVAAEHGRLSGRCCFCDRRLTDERSTSVGYGKTCSQNFGVPYPKLSEARAKVGDDLFAA